MERLLPKFKPSDKSYQKAEQATANLLYIRQAAQLLDRYVNREGTVPQWVEDRILHARDALGMSVSYLQNLERSKETK